MESGGTTTFPSFTAERNGLAWQNFVGNVSSCAAVANSGNTFSCLRNATTEQITAALLQTVTVNVEDLFNSVIWSPTIDGPGGVLPDHPSRLYSKGHFAKLPFIAGTDLDEGWHIHLSIPCLVFILLAELLTQTDRDGCRSPNPCHYRVPSRRVCTSLQPIWQRFNGCSRSCDSQAA
jgi:hypothetical protein